ncbi:hypothetical protein TNCV_1013881 [Trichonephila clavipes]|uniref:Uncharacterized protein n=1 Tax=Trichonephila clavipes TaxID=2585209 RepID=A0A8X6VXP9_TRICX|nr:hypothetical protein TNCV_1013881 [Trichonephila clavipes]
MRAIGDGPRSFEPRSNNGASPQLTPPLSISTTRQRATGNGQATQKSPGGHMRLSIAALHDRSRQRRLHDKSKMH